jgi:UDP-N-acetylmuramate dehydrogenase
MRINDSKLIAAIGALGVDYKPGVCLAEKTSLGIGGTSDMLVIQNHDALPELVRLLREAGVKYRFLGGGSNVLLPDGELPWVILQLARRDPDITFDGNSVWVDCAADLGRTVTTCAKHDLGGMEGLIGVPGTVGGALRMNAGAYGTQIGTHVREVRVFRGATGKIEILRGPEINFEYRHTSFVSDDIMLAVRLELPSKPYSEILQGIRICNEKRRASSLSIKKARAVFSRILRAGPPGA